MRKHTHLHTCENTVKIHYNSGHVGTNTLHWKLYSCANTLPYSVGRVRIIQIQCRQRWRRCKYSVSCPHQVSNPLIIRHRCSKCSCHERKTMTMTIIIIVEMITMIILKMWTLVVPNSCQQLWYWKQWWSSWPVTKESCRTLYWRFWLGKPGQGGVQIGSEKALVLIWAFDARPPRNPMPHKAPAVMESDIEWYKASHVFTGPCLMRRPRTTIQWGYRSRWRENHAQPCICKESLAEIQLQYAITVGL